MKENNLLAELAAYLFAASNAENGRTPSERELDEHFSVSRGQIREALAILEAMRIVERRAKSGIFLTTKQASVEAMALFAKAGLPLDHWSDTLQAWLYTTESFGAKFAPASAAPN